MHAAAPLTSLEAITIGSLAGLFTEQLSQLENGARSVVGVPVGVRQRTHLPQMVNS
jgi:predicted rRNA methylase YqxC with S4 and FtsJ domains